MITSTHLFKFRSYRDAGRNLFRDRARLAATPGLRFHSMPFTGSRASEGMKIGIVEPRRHMAWCIWESEQALEDFRTRSPIARRWLGATDEYCEIRCVPYRSYGTFRGQAPLGDLPAGKPGDGPVVVWTFANIPPRNLRRFYDGIARGTEALLPSPNLIAATAGPQRLYTGATTLTIWKSETDATRFAYHRQPHKQIVKDVKQEKLLIDSMFIRQTPYEILGTWPAHSRFAPRVAELARSLAAQPVAAGE